MKVMDRVSRLGFSLIEVLLVLALIGLVSSVVVVHFDSLENLFSTERATPVAVINEGLQYGRMWCAQKHQPADLYFEEKELQLKDKKGNLVQSFSWPKYQQDRVSRFYRLFSGILTSKGILRPNLTEDKVTAIPIDANGFFAGTFLELDLGKTKEQYEVDVLTGECTPARW